MAVALRDRKEQVAEKQHEADVHRAQHLRRHDRVRGIEVEHRHHHRNVLGLLQRLGVDCRLTGRRPRDLTHPASSARMLARSGLRQNLLPVDGDSAGGASRTSEGVLVIFLLNAASLGSSTINDANTES